MAHGLAIRRGSVSILCNGRSAVKPNGSQVNGFKGSYQELLSKMKVTEDNKTRILIPQESLTTHVDCHKCSCLMDPVKRKRYMKKIYANSWRWKARKSDRKAQKHNLLQPFTHSAGGDTETLTSHAVIPPVEWKACVLTISFQ